MARFLIGISYAYLYQWEFDLNYSVDLNYDVRFYWDV